MTQQQKIDAALDSQAKRVLQKAIEHERMRKHFYFTMDALSVYLDDQRNRDTDTVEQFLEAAEFAKTQGRVYPTEELNNWLLRELSK